MADEFCKNLLDSLETRYSGVFGVSDYKEASIVSLHYNPDLFLAAFFDESLGNCFFLFTEEKASSTLFLFRIISV